MMKLAALIIAASLPLASCATDMSESAMEPNTATASAMQPTTAMPYVAAAGASDLYEITSSRLALEKSTNSEIMRFARTMIDHHTRTTQQVTAAARTAGMTPPPPALMPMQQRMIDQLRPLSGDAFARAYVEQQRQAHQMALMLHRNYAQGGDTPQLRQTATAAVPIIEQHIRELQQL